MSEGSTDETPAAAMEPRRSAVWLLVPAFALLVAWSFVVPVFEAPDESHHWQYARYLHDTWRLPHYGPGFIEGNSPPLYYALIAPVAHRTDLPPLATWRDSERRRIVPLSPRFYLNAAGDFGRYWPVRLARLITALVSVATIYFCYLAGREWTGRHALGLLVGALAAFLPQFTFRGSHVSNDALVTMFGAATLYLLVRLLRRGFDWPTGLLLSGVLAAAFLSKASALSLAPAAAFVLLTTPVPWRVRLVRLTGVLAVWLALIAPWLIRNVVLYGDALASRAMYAAVHWMIDEKTLASSYFFTTFPVQLGRSFVAGFGFMNLWLPHALYAVYFALGAVGLVGSVWTLRRVPQQRRLLVTLLMTVLATLAVVVRINLQFTQPQGRYMFPALPAIALLVALGVDSLFRSPHATRRLVQWTMGGLLGLNLYILGAIVAPAYYPAVVGQLVRTSVRLAPSATHGLVPLGGQKYRIVDANPQVVYKGDVSAESLGFLELRLSGTLPDPHVAGSMYFARSGEAIAESQPLRFEWRADGRPRRIVLPLLLHPLWRGRVTTIRIDPLEPADAEHTGGVISLGSLRVRGSLPSPSY